MLLTAGFTMRGVFRSQRRRAWVMAVLRVLVSSGFLSVLQPLLKPVLLNKASAVHPTQSSAVILIIN